MEAWGRPPQPSLRVEKAFNERDAIMEGRMRKGNKRAPVRTPASADLC